jgi:tetratricopeptide (TPR) repeat protein
MPGNKQVFNAAMSAADRFRWDSQWTEAAREYQRALAEFPEDAAARGGLGFCYMQTRQWQLALDEYEFILRRDSSNVIALSKIAELYAIFNRRDDAQQAYLYLAEAYVQASQGQRAEAAWQKAIQLAPGNPEPHERLAAYYVGKKDIALMIQERLAAAQGYLQRNQMDAARKQCEEVLRADKTNEQAKLLLSHIMQPAGSVPQGARAQISQTAGTSTGPMADATLPVSPSNITGSSITGTVSPVNTSGGNTSIMGNTGSTGNFSGAGNSMPNAAMAGMNGDATRPAPHKRITAGQVTGVLRQAQTFQTQGKFNDAIDLCEQILASGFDRPDARYFLGWLYQEQQRWDDAIRQFQMLLNDPDYALSCYYALGQCFRARGDLQTASFHFDEAVDRVNLDALTVEESDQLVQLCQEAAEAHYQLRQQDQAITVYNALLGFLRSRGWNDKVSQVEIMLKQLQQAQPPPSLPSPPQTPPPAMPYTVPQQQPYTAPQSQGNTTRVLPPEQMANMSQVQSMPGMGYAAPQQQGNQTYSLPPEQMQTSQMPSQPHIPVQPPISSAPVTAQTAGELPDWLTGIISDSDKTQVPNRQSQPRIDATAAPTVSSAPADPAQMNIINQPTMEQQVISSPQAALDAMAEVTMRKPMPPVAAQPPTAPSQPLAVLPDSTFDVPKTTTTQNAKGGAEELLSQMAGSSAKDEALKQAAEAVLASTSSLPDDIRVQVVQSMQDIQKYINFGLLTPATEECLRVIEIAPQYVDVHQVLCEIYVRQGQVDQAIAKYATLADTYVANGRIDDAIAVYRRILQLEPNNLTHRTRLINLLASQGYKEDLLRERTQVAESYLRLGYLDRAVTELEQALKESPTSVPTRLNYALALQKLGHSQQAVVEYQRVLQIDPRNIAALVRWHIAMVTGNTAGRATTLEVLTRIRFQMRGQGQRNFEMVMREYNHAAETQPNNADIQFALGQMYQQAGSFDKAVEAYRVAQQDSSLEVMARVSAAHCLLAQGKPEAAIDLLEQALQSVRRSPGGSLDPATWATRPREEGEEHQAPEVEISKLLAKAYGRVGRQDQMEAILRQIKQTTTDKDEVASTLAEISARQSDVNAVVQEYADLVRYYRNKRQVESALKTLNEMVRIAPQDPRAHAELGDIYIGRGLLDEGIAELRLLADIYLRRDQKEDAGETLRRIGNIYAEMGSDEEALTNLQRAVELTPDDMDLLREVVGFCWRTGNTKDATHYQTMIARYYFQTQQVKESVAALQQLITMDRNNSEAYDMLGQTYQSVGEYEQASRVYRNLAKINPQSPVAQERLLALQELRTAH